MNKQKLRRNQESVNNKPAKLCLQKCLQCQQYFLNVRKCELRDNEKTN